MLDAGMTSLWIAHVWVPKMSSDLEWTFEAVDLGA
jgi:hypothetical protein